MNSKVESLTQELIIKNKYITDLEGDVKQLKAMAVAENMQYLRHTLVKFLCDSTKSEQTKIVNVVEQLLEMTQVYGFWYDSLVLKSVPNQKRILD